MYWWRPAPAFVPRLYATRLCAMANNSSTSALFRPVAGPEANPVAIASCKRASLCRPCDVAETRRVTTPSGNTRTGPCARPTIMHPRIPWPERCHTGRESLAYCVRAGRHAPRQPHRHERACSRGRVVWSRPPRAPLTLCPPQAAAHKVRVQRPSSWRCRADPGVLRGRSLP